MILVLNIVNNAHLVYYFHNFIFYSPILKQHWNTAVLAVTIPLNDPFKRDIINDNLPL